MTQAQAINILKTGASVFLMGEPGSGKTHTINNYVSWLKKHGISPAITASTGIAATHIGGMTIHSFSGIGINDSLSEYDIDRIASIERIHGGITDTKVLIIDEVSMLDGVRLNMVDRIFRAVKRSEMPFGGTQVILVGDFFQLPPVTRGRQEVHFAFDSEAWQTLNPVVCYLTEQHRQEDTSFTRLLNAIRRNSVDEDHHEIILSRKMEFTKVPQNIPKLFSHNVDVDRINNLELAKLPGEARQFKMNSQGSKSLVEQLKRGCLSPELLELKPNASVMFTKNSRGGSYVNGSLGTVTGFSEDTGYPVVQIKNGAKMEVMPAEWIIEEHGRKKAAIMQFPLRLAWAITVHKSQGMSMDAAVMDLSGVFEYGQGYVALSRVRTLDGLYICGINERAFAVHPQILAKDAEFVSASDTAIDKLDAMNSELASLHEQFIRACGGSVEEVTVKESAFKPSVPKSEHRWEQTFELISSGKTIEETASIRGRTAGTIVAHLEELKVLGKLDPESIAHLMEPRQSQIAEIQKAFEVVEPSKLRTVFDHFQGRHTFDDIRLARLFYKL